jgi:hypothetical protein
MGWTTHTSTNFQQRVSRQLCSAIPAGYVCVSQAQVALQHWRHMGAGKQQFESANNAPPTQTTIRQPLPQHATR